MPVNKRIFGVLVGVLLLATLLAKVDLRQVANALGDSEPAWSATGIALFVVMVAIDAWRLQVAFDGYTLSYRLCLSVQTAGFFVSNFTPGMAGADLVKVLIAHRVGTGMAPAVALTLLLRVLGMCCLWLLTSTYLLLLPDRLAPLVEQLQVVRVPSPAAAATAILLAVSILVGLVVVLRRRGTWFVRAVADSANAVRHLGFWALVKLLFLTMVMIFVGALSLFTLGLAVNADLSLPDTVVVLTLLTFGSVLPATPGAIGLREGAIAGGFVAFGAGPAEAVAVALLHRAGFWLVSLVGWGSLHHLRGAGTDATR